MYNQSLPATIDDMIVDNGNGEKQCSISRSSSIDNVPLLRTDTMTALKALNRNSMIIPETTSIDPPLVIKTSDYTSANSNVVGRAHNTSNIVEKQCKLFNSLVSDLRAQFQKEYQFRVIHTKWEDSQMSDLYITKSNIPESMDVDQVYRIKLKQKPTTDPLTVVNKDAEDATATCKEFYVNIKVLSDCDQSPSKTYPCLEMNDVLMAHLQLHQLDRITLSSMVATPLNAITRLELLPSKCVNGYRECRTIEDAFKSVVLENTKLFPMLINQRQLFRLDDGTITVIVKIYPETLRYCLCDSEVLRQCKVTCVEEVSDVSTLLRAAEQITHAAINDSSGTSTVVDIAKFLDIRTKCIEQIIFDLCLDNANSLRRVSNFLIIGN